MKILVDFSGVQAAVGRETTWYAGEVKVGDTVVCVDGTTDRSSWGPVQLAMRQVFVAAEFDIPEDRLYPEEVSEEVADCLLDLLYDNDTGSVEVEVEGPAKA